MDHDGGAGAGFHGVAAGHRQHGRDRHSHRAVLAKVRGAAWTLPLAVLGAGVIIQGIKMEFKRPRPTFFSPLLHELGYSFPSGHSLIAIVVYGLLGYFALHLVHSRAAKRAVRAVTVLLIICIGISRPYVQVHYPTDVLAGWTAGLPWLMTCIWLHEALTRHFARRATGAGQAAPDFARREGRQGRRQDPRGQPHTPLTIVGMPCVARPS